MERATPDRAVRVADHGAGETNDPVFLRPTAKKAKSEADDGRGARGACLEYPHEEPAAKSPAGKKQLPP